MEDYPGSNISETNYDFGYTGIKTDIYEPARLNRSVATPGVYEID